MNLVRLGLPQPLPLLMYHKDFVHKRDGNIQLHQLHVRIISHAYILMRVLELKYQNHHHNNQYQQDLFHCVSMYHPDYDTLDVQEPVTHHRMFSDYES